MELVLVALIGVALLVGSPVVEQLIFEIRK
jgi:hypothetical protein